VAEPILRRADLWLWRLPVVARKAIVAPVAVVVGVLEAWPDVTRAWRMFMEAVEARPEVQPPDPNEGRGMGAASPRQQATTEEDQ
jgi:hypothetical protein